MRASSSAGWNGARQKSSNSSSRSSRSASWAPEISARTGGLPGSRLRIVRANAHAPVASLPQSMIAPAHPLGGSNSAASSADATAFQR